MSEFVKDVINRYNLDDKYNKKYVLNNYLLSKKEKHILKILKENDKNKINELIFDFINFDEENGYKNENINLDKIELYINHEFIQFYKLYKNKDLLYQNEELIKSIEKFTFNAKYLIIGDIYDGLYSKYFFEDINKFKKLKNLSLKYYKLYPSFKSYYNIVTIFQRNKCIKNFYLKKMLFLAINYLKKGKKIYYGTKNFRFVLYINTSEKLNKIKYFFKKLCEVNFVCSDKISKLCNQKYSLINKHFIEYKYYGRYIDKKYVLIFILNKIFISDKHRKMK